MPTLILVDDDGNDATSPRCDKASRSRRASMGHATVQAVALCIRDTLALKSIKKKYVREVYDAFALLVKDTDEAVDPQLMEEVETKLGCLHQKGGFDMLKESLLGEIWRKSAGLSLTLVGFPQFGPLRPMAHERDEWSMVHVLSKKLLEKTLGEKSKNLLILLLLTLRVLQLHIEEICLRLGKNFFRTTMEEKAKHFNVSDYRRLSPHPPEFDVTVFKTVDLVLEGVGILESEFGNPMIRKELKKKLHRRFGSTMVTTRKRQGQPLPPPETPKARKARKQHARQPTAEEEAEDASDDDDDDDDELDVAAAVHYRKGDPNKYIKYVCPFCRGPKPKEIFINIDRYERIDLRDGQLILKADNKLYHRDEVPIPYRLRESGERDYQKSKDMQKHHEKAHPEQSVFPRAYAPLRAKGHARQDSASVKLRKRETEKAVRAARAERFKNGTQTNEDIEFRKKEKIRSAATRKAAADAAAKKADE